MIRLTFGKPGGDRASVKLTREEATQLRDHLSAYLDKTKPQPSSGPAVAATAVTAALARGGV